LWFEVSLGIVCYETVSSKIARTKWVGDVAQAVEYLLRKREVLSLNPQPHQKKKNSFQLLFNILIWIMNHEVVSW
jgi:hypothetical protein